MFQSWANFISLENIYQAWKDFSANKKNKRDVINFKMNLEEEILRIHSDLKNNKYQHGSYTKFKVWDPKERMIHKAEVHDRLIHRLLYNYLIPSFNRHWLDCSFSCRPGFGQHHSVEKVRKSILKATANYNKECWVVKCDIKKFFDHINHDILFKLVCRKIFDPSIRGLIWKVIDSFSCGSEGVGIPIGNLTSQIFANVYLHELDLYAKHNLKIRHYFRYADDFLFLTETKKDAECIVEKFKIFLTDNLKLTVHPNKIIIRQASSGIDWLGKILLPGYILLRSSTKRRMMIKIKKRVESCFEAENLQAVVGSYNGLLLGTARKTVDRQIAQAVAFNR